MRHLLAVTLIVGLALVGCSGDDDPASGDPASGDPASADTASGAGDPAGEAAGPLCDAFLTFLGAPIGEVDAAIVALGDALGPDAPPEALAALVVLGPAAPADTEPGEFAAALADLSAAVQPTCGATFRAGLVPAPTDDLAATTFAEALIAGDRATAEILAPDDVIALFEPWERFPADATAGTPTYTVDAGVVTVSLAPAYTAYCDATDGLVTGCSFGE